MLTLSDLEHDLVWEWGHRSEISYDEVVLARWADPMADVLTRTRTLETDARTGRRPCEHEGRCRGTSELQTNKAL